MKIKQEFDVVVVETSGDTTKEVYYRNFEDYQSDHLCQEQVVNISEEEKEFPWSEHEAVVDAMISLTNHFGILTDGTQSSLDKILQIYNAFKGTKLSLSLSQNTRGYVVSSETGDVPDEVIACLKYFSPIGVSIIKQGEINENY